METRAERPEHETKFLLSALRAPTVLRALELHLEPDPLYPRGVVESIYFDTRSFELLAEKLASDWAKTKVRLRFYPGSGGTSYLEVKRRWGTRRLKLRVETPESAARLATAPLSDTALARLPHLLHPRGVPTPADLLPVFVVRYHRHRFVDRLSGARVALDTEITVPRSHTPLLPAGKATPLGAAVLEVKGESARLPHRLAFLAELGCRKSSFSKYSACWEHLWKDFRI